MWFAIRTAPGAQMPQREYVAETTKSFKGYRIVPSLDPNRSAVEKALTEAGFIHFMPAERRLIRDRKKLGVWTTRRFPMLQGYAFVADVTDFERLEHTAGVLEVVRMNGSPYRVADQDIQTLRQVEAECDAAVDGRLKAIEEKARKPTRGRVGRMFPVGATVMVHKILGDTRMATVAGAARDGRVKVILEGLDRAVEVPAGPLELVA